MSTLLIDTDVNTDVVIDHYTDDTVSDQLTAIGFTPGTPIKVVSKLPFNGPIACECRNTKFAIRAEDAAQIIVA